MFSKLVWRSVVGRPARWLLTLAAVFVPSALVTGAANFVLDADSKMTREARVLGANLIVVPRVAARALTAEEGATVASIAGSGARQVGIGEESSEISAPRNPETIAVVVTVTDLPALAELHPDWGGSAEEAVVGRRLAERCRLSIGDRIVVGGKPRFVRLIASIDGPWDRAVIVQGTPARLTRIEAHVDPREAEAIAGRIDAAVPAAEARPVRAIAAAESRFLARLRNLFGVIALFVLAISALGIAMTLTAAVAEKRKEIGLMKALGASPPVVLKLLAAQIAIVLVGGLASGAAAGVGLSDFLGRRVFGVGTELRPVALAIAAGACLVMAATAATVPARRSLSVDPAEVLKEE